MHRRVGYARICEAYGICHVEHEPEDDDGNEPMLQERVRNVLPQV